MNILCAFVFDAATSELLGSASVCTTQVRLCCFVVHEHEQHVSNCLQVYNLTQHAAAATTVGSSHTTHRSSRSRSSCCYHVAQHDTTQHKSHTQGNKLTIWLAGDVKVRPGSSISLSDLNPMLTSGFGLGVPGGPQAFSGGVLRVEGCGNCSASAVEMRLTVSTSQPTPEGYRCSKLPIVIDVLTPLAKTHTYAGIVQQNMLSSPAKLARARSPPPEPP